MSEYDKKVLVTGVSGLIGQAIAYKLLKSNISVIGTYNKNYKNVENFKKKIEKEEFAKHFHPYQCELMDEQSVHQCVNKVIKEHKIINAFICNAAVKLRLGFMFTSNTNIENVLNTNLKSIMVMSKLIIKNMIKQKQGRIVLIGSRAGSTGMPNQSVYSATKSALIGWVKSIAFELGGYGITANIVSPGALKDPEHYNEQEEKDILNLIGLKRLCEPEEVANLVHYLCSDEASYISGTEIVIDGAARF